jgi:NTP pyrophosphatase (non-canonical NTP hydrolase)
MSEGMGYDIVDWHNSLKTALVMLAKDLHGIMDALNAGNISAVRMRAGLAILTMDHIAGASEAPSFSLDAELKNVLAWSHQTFPTQTESTMLLHLRDELAELSEEPSKPGELADVVMLVAALADYHDVDLAKAVREKLAVNRARHWTQEDANGMRSHDRRSEP